MADDTEESAASLAPTSPDALATLDQQETAKVQAQPVAKKGTPPPVEYQKRSDTEVPTGEAVKRVVPDSATPIGELPGAQVAAPPPPPVDPNALPSWQDVTQTDTYRNASLPDRFSMLDNYVAQARDIGHGMAAQNKEDPALYDKHLDQFRNQERGNIGGPFQIFSDIAQTAVNTGEVVLKGAISETAKMVTGGLEAGKQILQPEMDFSDIGKLSVGQAKAQRDQIAAQQDTLEEQSQKADAYLQDRFAGVMDPSKQFPGGQTAAVSVMRTADANKRRLAVLDKYIASGGTEAPVQTPTEAASEAIKTWPQAAENAIPIEDTYLKEHPKLAATADVVGRVLPFIGAGVVASATGNVAGVGAEGAMLGEAGIQLLTNSADAFQNGYESAEAKIEAREKNGEYFSPYEREQLKLNNASLDAFGVGSWQAASNLILSSATHGMVHTPSEGTVNTLRQNLQNLLQNPDKLLLKGVTAGGTELAGQTALQAGAQFLGNVGARVSGVSPDQDLTEGLNEAAQQGLTFGAAGLGLRGVSTSFRWGVDNFKINRYADNVRSMADQVEAPPDATNEQKFEIALKQNVPEKYQDGVRAKIALQESAKDQAQVADELDQSGSSQTAQAMRDTAATTANTNVAAVRSPEQLIAELKAHEAAKKANKEAAEGKEPV